MGIKRREQVMKGLNSALFTTLSLLPLFLPSLGFQCPAVLVLLILHLSPNACIIPKITLLLPRATMEIKSKKWMPKALRGPAFHHNQVTSLLFIQQSSSPFWYLPTIWL